jgi:YHS domain-containing protein
MRSLKATIFVTCSLLGMITAGWLRGQDKNSKEFALRGLDPVELTRGRESEGEDRFAASSGKFRYRFVSDENRRLFETDPERYGIRFGGACMRMGPLSGGGDSDRFVVHAGGIYVFASDACRNTFLKSPDRYVIREDPKIAQDEESSKRASDVLDRAVEALGGKEKLLSLKTLGIDLEIILKTPESETRFIRKSILGHDFDYFTEDVYDTYRGGWKISGGRGFFTWGKGEYAAPSVSRFMTRTLMHEPVAVLKSFLAGKCQAMISATGEDADSDSDAVIVNTGEGSTTLIVDRKTGQIKGTRFDGWGNLGMSRFERTYEDFSTFDGLSLPRKISTRVDGKVTEGLTTRIVSIRINDPADSGRTTVPPAGAADSK